MFHARKYHLEFASPMIVHNNLHIYVNDFIRFEHSVLGASVGKILKYYKKVYVYVHVSVILYQI